MNIKGLRLSLVFAFAFLWSHENLSAQVCPIRVTANPSKPSYVADEPIDVTVRFENQTSAEILVAVNLPRLLPSSGTFFSFTPTARLKVVESGVDLGGSLTPMPVPPAGSAVLHVYLQRFMTGFMPGIHDLPWEFQAQCIADSRHAQTGITSARGLWRIQVDPGDPFSLRGVLDQHMAKLQTTLDPTVRRESVEALLVVSSPSIIPYLERLIAPLGYTDQAFTALAKFGGNPEARQALLRTLHSGSEYQAGAAVKVLLVWNETLPESDLTALLERHPVPALTYIGGIRNAAHLPFVERYLTHSNPAISKAANEARAKLGR
jgi:hypothetical protein